MSTPISPAGRIYAPPATSFSRGEETKKLARDPGVRATAQHLVAISPALSDHTKVGVTTDVTGEAPKQVEVKLRDVNGDGLKDAVVTDKSTGASSALISRGQGSIDAEPVNLTAPAKNDLDRLAVQGKKTNSVFLAVDLEGEGKRQFAVKDGDKWVSLGQTGDALNDGADASGSAVDEAEDRFEKLVAELAWVVPAFALGEQSGSDSRPVLGFVQMLNGNVDPNPMHAFDLNDSNIGGLVMMDSMGSAVGAFDPFGVGMMLYADQSGGALLPPVAATDAPAGVVPNTAVKQAKI